MDSDSSESGESEDNQNNQYRQFNKRDTEVVEKCVTEVLKLIKKALIKDTKCRKEPIKTIKKETKKTKLKKHEVADQIQRLCNEIKAIASTPVNPATEVPQSSRYCDIVPGTSRSETEKTPGNLKSTTEKDVPGTSRISSNRLETTKSATSQGNTELVVFGNVGNHAEAKTSLSGITASSGTTGSLIEREPGPSRSYLQPSIPESLRSMEGSKTSTSNSNVAASGTLRQIETVALEISKSASKIQLVFSKSVAVSAPKMSKKHVETSNSRAVIHLRNGGSHPQALFGIFGNRSEVGSPRSRFVTEVCEAPASISDAVVTNTFKNMETVVPEISSASTNKIPVANESPAQTTPEISKNCTEIVTTETSGSFTKPVKETSRTHHGTDRSCIQETPGTPKTLAEAATGPSRSLSKTKDPESSRRNKELEMSEAPPSSSDGAVTNTSRNIKTVVPEISSASTNTNPGTTKSPTQTTPKPSKNYTERVVTETSDSFTKPLKGASKTHHGTDGSCIQATPGTSETLAEAATGPSRSLFKTKDPESSRRNKEKEVSEAPAKSSDAAVTNTSRNMKTVVPEISSDSTNTIPGTTKSPTQTTPKPSKNCTKPLKEATKTHHGTDGSCIHATPGTPETIAEAGTRASKSPSKTKDPESFRRHRETEVSTNNYKSITSRLDVAESENSRHTKTIAPDTSSWPSCTNAVSGTSKHGSNAVASGTSRNKTDAISPGMSGSVNTVVVNGLLNKRDENITHKESNNSQICSKTKVNISGSDQINNNSTTKRRNGANLKSNILNNDDPKIAKIEHKCTLCGKVINKDLAKHYKKRHGMHHEIKHNNENYEHKIQDLNKRLQNPIGIDTSKSNNEQKYKITAESKKRTAAMSFYAPNEETVANTTAGINVDSDKVEEPTEKKKRTATRSDSTPNENIEQTNAPLKSEPNRNTVLDDFIVDLTDNTVGKTKPPTQIIVKKCSPKPVDDYQVLNDHQFVDLSDDTSLYDILIEEEVKSAEALLLENVKEEQASNSYVVDVVSNSLPNNKKSSDKKSRKTIEHSTDETKQKLTDHESLLKQNDCKEILPETLRRGRDIVAKVLTNSKKDSSGDLSLESPETDKKHTKFTKPRTFINPAKINASENAESRTEDGFGTAGYRIEFGAGTSTSVPHIETIEFSRSQLKEPAISINEHLTQAKQRKAQHDSSKRRNDKRKSPYEKPNKTFSNRISSGTVATKTSITAPKVAMINATTTQRTQKTNEPISVEKNFSTGTNPTRVKAEVSVTILKTTDLSIQQTHEAKPNSAQKHSFKSKSSSELKTDSLPGLGIKTIDAPKESLPNTTSVSLPNSTTITPIQVTQKANQTSASNRINATGVSRSISVPPTPSKNIISTSNIMKSAIQQQSVLQKFHSVMANFPSGLTNIASQRLDSVAPNTSTRISSSASVAPANVSLQSNHKTGLPVIKSNQWRPVSSTVSDISRNAQKLTGHVKPTPSISVQSAPKQHSNTTARTNKSDFQKTSNTPRRKSVPAFDAHSDHKKRNTSVDLQSPQIPWYPPLLLGALNTSSSSVASRNSNRRASVNLNDAHPQTYSWHTPVEPENERPETSTNVSQSVTLNNLSLSFSNPVEIRHQTNSRTINQRPNKQRTADARQPSSISEVGWQNLVTPRHQSTLLQDQRLRLPQTERTWHTPVKRPAQN